MYRRQFMVFGLAATMAAALLGTPTLAADESIIVQSTTSTQNSGLFNELLPKFEKDTGIKANVVAVGTGQAIKNAQNCDGDVLFVHSKPDEVKFVENGHGLKRHDVMYNDFVIVGPKSDLAGVSGMKDVSAALKKIAEASAPFASRGDNSGTHKAELRLWQDAGVDPTQASGTWYRETGSGMGATLNAAAGMGAYALADRGTWISFKNKADMDIVVEGDDKLFNQYGVIAVNPAKCPSVKADAARKFVDWVISPEGQKAIADYKIEGEQLFFPNAGKGQS